MSQIDSSPHPPVAPQRATILHNHGEERVDPYFWLRVRDDPQVIDYLNAENAYAEIGRAHV